MVHEADEEAPLRFGQRDWQQMKRLDRQKLLTTAYSAERRLTLQIGEAKRILEDHSELRRALPDLRGEVHAEAASILGSDELHLAATDLKEAFNTAREAWLRVPTFKRHELWDIKLKKRALKMLKVLA